MCAHVAKDLCCCSIALLARHTAHCAAPPGPAERLACCSPLRVGLLVLVVVVLLQQLLVLVLVQLLCINEGCRCSDQCPAGAQRAAACRFTERPRRELWQQSRIL